MNIVAASHTNQHKETAQPCWLGSMEPSEGSGTQLPVVPSHTHGQHGDSTWRCVQDHGQWSLSRGYLCSGCLLSPPAAHILDMWPALADLDLAEIQIQKMIEVAGRVVFLVMSFLCCVFSRKNTSKSGTEPGKHKAFIFTASPVSFPRGLNSIDATADLESRYPRTSASTSQPRRQPTECTSEISSARHKDITDNPPGHIWAKRLSQEWAFSSRKP